MLELGTERDSVQFRTFGTGVARDGRGRIVIAPVNGADSIAVFDSLGTLLRVFGSKGNSQSELQQISAIDITDHDTLMVFDALRHSVSYFDPEWRFVRTVPLRADLRSFSALAFGDIGTLGYGAFPKAQPPQPVVGGIHQFHRFSGATGDHELSFGDTLTYGPDGSVVQTVLSANGAPDGTVWMLKTEPVRLVAFDTLGKVQHEVLYQPDWLPYPALPVPMIPGYPPPGTKHFPTLKPKPAQAAPGIHRIRIAQNGRVAFLLGLKPKRGWEKRDNPHLYKSQTPAGGHALGVLDPDVGRKMNVINGWFDTVIDAVDLGTGRGMGSVSLPFSGSPQLLRDGYVATLQGNANGTLTVVIWSIGLPTATTPQ